MRTRALQALLTAFILHGAAPAVAQMPQRHYVPRLYRSAIEREVLVGHDARRLGMGSAGVAWGASPDAVVWSPAALAGIEYTSVGVMDSASAATSESRGGAASLATPLAALVADATGALGASAWIGDWGEEADKQRAFVAGYGATVGPLAAGLALRHERHYFDADTLSAWTGDVGVAAAGTLRRRHSWRAGLVVSHLGQALRDQRGLLAPKDFNPSRVSAGGQYSLGAGPTLATSLSYIGDTRRDARDRVRWRVGAEQSLLEGRLAVRAGYNSIANYDRISHGLASVGMSANVGGAGLDYAFVTGSDGLGETFGSRHYVSFRVAWAGAQLASDDGALDGGFTLPASAMPTPVSVREGAFSPNGDGVRDTFVLDVGADEPGASVVVTARDGAPVRTIPVSDRMVASWDGRTQSGAAAPDGLYRWDVVVRDRVIRSGLALLDASPPVLRLSPSPVAFVSGVERPQGSVAVSVDEANAIEQWSLSVTHDGSSLATLADDAGAIETLAAADIKGLQPGRAYEITLRVVDEAGAEAVESAQFTALDMRAHAAWVEDDVVYADAPSTYFDAASAGLSREGRDLAASAALDPSLHVAIDGGTGALTANRLETMRAALVSEGMPPHHITSTTTAGLAAPSSGLRLAISSRPAVATTDAAVAPQEHQPDGTYRVLVGSFRDRGNAEIAESDLTASGFDARVREVQLPSGTWFRVVVGAFDSREEAATARERVQAHVAGDTVILTPAIP